MPELPEVETVRRGLIPVMEGQRIVSVKQNRPNLRIPFPENFPKRLKGCRLERLDRRAKYLLGHLDNGEVLIIHLGMSGSMTIHKKNKRIEKPHDHAVFTMEDGTTVVFNDPRRFGLITLCDADDLETHPYFADMGPEPLGNSFSAATLSDALRGRKTPIKAALLNQKIVAGLGNIYVCEALYRADISPKRSAHTVAGKRAERLVPVIRDVLNEAIAAGGSSLNDYVQASGELGYFQHRFSVYDREGEDCSKSDCSGVVTRIVQSNRSTFFCPKCQR